MHWNNLTFYIGDLKIRFHEPALQTLFELLNKKEMKINIVFEIGYSPKKSSYDDDNFSMTIDEQYISSDYTKDVIFVLDNSTKEYSYILIPRGQETSIQTSAGKGAEFALNFFFKCFPILSALNIHKQHETLILAVDSLISLLK